MKENVKDAIFYYLDQKSYLVKKHGVQRKLTTDFESQGATSPAKRKPIVVKSYLHLFHPVILNLKVPLLLQRASK